MHYAGGMAVIAKRLLDSGILLAGEKTVSGRSIGEEARAAAEAPGQSVIRPLKDPLKKERRADYSPRQPCPGRLRAEASSGQEREAHRGPARASIVKKTLLPR